MKNPSLCLVLLLPGLVAAGCNAGMAPSGMSNEEARSALGKLSPEDQIRYYQSSPMPAADKEKKIAEVRQKYGLAAGVGATGAPNGGTGQPLGG